MIAISSSGKSFTALAKYLERGRDGDAPERVAWTAVRNLPTDDPALVAKIMRATAAENARVGQPVYHLALSFDPRDAVDRATMERIADRVLAALTLEQHQVLIVAHRDRDHAHMHLLINRIHPETGKAWDRWQDQRIVQEVLREEERTLGLRQVQGTLTPERDTAAHLSSDPQLIRREQFTASQETQAAKIRTTRLDAAAERVTATARAFEDALGLVYTNPSTARNTFHTVADAAGRAAAIETLRTQPERFGALVAIQRRGMLGMLSHADDAPARAAAVDAAARAHAHHDALDAMARAAAESRARRLEVALNHALARIYTAPHTAKDAITAYAKEHGADNVASQLSAKPAQFGAIHPSLRRRRAELTHLATDAATLFTSLHAARATAVTAPVQMHGTWIEAERPEAARALTSASAYEAQLAEHLRGISPLDALARRAARHVTHAVEPPEVKKVRKLRRAATSPGVFTAATVRGAVRDAILGRDEERGR